MRRLLSPVLFGLVAVLAVSQHETSSDRPTPAAYEISEAYQVYAAVLPEQWTWKVAQSKALLIKAETVAAGMCMRPYKASAQVLGPAIADYNEVNRKTWLLQRNFEIEKPYDLVPAKDINRVLENDSVGGWKPISDERPKYVGWLELSAVGFNADQTVAVLYVGHHCGSLCGGGRFYVLQKKSGKWLPLRWTGSTCSWDS